MIRPMHRALVPFLLATLAACGPSPQAPAAGARASTAEEARVEAAIAALDSLRIARAAAIPADEAVDAETFARVCQPVGRQAAALSAEHGWQVRQLAARYRNPANAADPVTDALLQQFEADPALVDLWMDAADQSGPGRRYVRRIVVQETCLACHGARKARPAFVVANYPEDRAYGFRAGDLRGVYSVFVPDRVQTTAP